MACRAMYYKIRPEHIGRDRFEHLCAQWGFVNKQKLNFKRTTDSSGVVRFDNLTIDLELTDINQLFSSDITYFDLDSKFYYLTFIIDCYSRCIIGHSVAATLVTEATTLPALKMALSCRKMNWRAGIIFHSDAGGQYYDKAFLKLTQQYQLRNSMCEFAYENGKAERVNGVIKNNYLRHWRIKSFDQLAKAVDRAVTLYNTDKPHKALKNKTPQAFEKALVLK
jgi:putative transposase